MPSLAAAIAPAPIATIADAIVMMQAIDQVLPEPDGLKWFNVLYLAVTEAVADAVAAGNVYADVAWIVHLDVVFANLYFDAVARSLDATTPLPRAWQPLFDSRFDPHVARIQYALAGMNAHINRDLVLALVQTHNDMGTVPDRDSIHFQDFTVVDDILASVEAQMKPILLTGVLPALDGTLGTLDDILAMWSVSHARQAAWTNSEVSWSLLPFPFVNASFLRALDRTAGFAGRGLLLPTQF